MDIIAGTLGFKVCLKPQISLSHSGLLLCKEHNVNPFATGKLPLQFSCTGQNEDGENEQGHLNAAMICSIHFITQLFNKLSGLKCRYQPLAMCHSE